MPRETRQEDQEGRKHVLSGKEGGVPVLSPEVPTSAPSSPSVTALHHPSSQVVCLLTTEEDGVPVFIPFTHSCPAPAFPQLPTLLFLPCPALHCTALPCPALVNLPGQYKTNYTLPGQYKTNYTQPTMVSKDSDINGGPQRGRRQWGVLSSRLWRSSLSALVFEVSEGLLPAEVGSLVTLHLSCHRAHWL